jgi:ubiquinone/menaquinone biosynthesis C-methylase UbiE
MLAAAKERLTPLSNIEFLESDTAHIPLADASVDAAVSVLLLHHVPDIAVVLREMRRISRGPAVVIDIAEHDRDEYRRIMGHRLQGIPPMMMNELMHSAGFTNVTYHPLPHEPGSKGPGLFVATGRV